MQATKHVWGVLGHPDQAAWPAWGHWEVANALTHLLLINNPHHHLRPQAIHWLVRYPTRRLLKTDYTRHCLRAKNLFGRWNSFSFLTAERDKFFSFLAVEHFYWSVLAAQLTGGRQWGQLDRLVKSLLWHFCRVVTFILVVVTFIVVVTCDIWYLCCGHYITQYTFSIWT